MRSQCRHLRAVGVGARGLRQRERLLGAGGGDFLLPPGRVPARQPPIPWESVWLDRVGNGCRGHLAQSLLQIRTGSPAVPSTVCSVEAGSISVLLFQVACFRVRRLAEDSGRDVLSTLEF